MDLAALKQAVTGLSGKSHNDKILIFGWWLHVYKKQASFTGAQIGKCYAELHYAPPSAFGPYIAALVDRKDLLKIAGGYKLEYKIREKFDAAYGESETTIKVSNLLADLAAKIPDMASRVYYQEALTCYTHGSRRAAVVMTWNIAYAHLCDHTIAKRLADFNARWQLSYPGMHKKAARTIATFDDFAEELKESEVIAICRDAGIIKKNVYNIMHAALGRRNAAAHPNSVIIDQLQTDAFITDLIVNVIQQIV